MDGSIKSQAETSPDERFAVRKRYILRKTKSNINYYYVNHDQVGLIWRNVILFTILHLLFLKGAYVALTRVPWSVWIFGFAYGLLGGLGITAGAHRLWSHKSYKARLPLRIFLMFCNCVAIQSDVIGWSRDHRLHHKFTDTDADPYNIGRGWFFAHMGWLMRKRHPKVMEMGAKLDMDDLNNDPLLAFQKRYYWPLAVTIGLVVPVVLCPMYFDTTLWDSFFIFTSRFVLSQHCTFFVNSAAHIWGDQDYDESIEPRESKLVSFGALGEGFHNYHHTFPYDYSTSEHGGYINITTIFLDFMGLIGLAHSFKKVDPDVISRRRARTGKQVISAAPDVVKYLV